MFTIRAGKFIYTVPSNEPDEKFEKYAKLIDSTLLTVPRVDGCAHGRPAGAV